ncbi:hypothetical protein GCM10027403_07710 [Arthrobacter tecti]
MKILGISGSTRADSFNSALIRMVATALPEHDVEVVANLAALPYYNADDEAREIPDAVENLRQLTAQSDMLVIATPEYNGTTPGVLMNAVEWVSRPHRSSALTLKPVLVISASPTPGGGRRSAAHLRSVLERIGADVSPVEFAVPRAHGALNPETAEYRETSQRLDGVLRTVAAQSPALAG